MTERTATINGVQLTEAQLREGLKQLERQAEGILFVSPWGRHTYLNIPVHLVQAMVSLAQNQRLDPHQFVTLHVDGSLGFHLTHYEDFRPLKEFTS